MGRPYGGGFSDPDNSSLVTLGGVGGNLVLGFDDSVVDDPANPFGLDCIVYGNGHWVLDNPNRKWAECGVIEISVDANSNGLADDSWYLIPGSHIVEPSGQWSIWGWDDDISDLAFPPLDATWIPNGFSGYWTTQTYLLPECVFSMDILENANGLGAEEESVWGYADLSPTESLPGGVAAEDFYARPDNPFAVGLTPGCGGGDGFDIAWAIDENTGEPAGLSAFDFIKITSAVDYVSPMFGEKSTEVDAVVDVQAGSIGDADGDGDIDVHDYEIMEMCIGHPGMATPTSPCRVVDFDGDGDVDLSDYCELQRGFGN